MTNASVPLEAPPPTIRAALGNAGAALRLLLPLGLPTVLWLALLVIAANGLYMLAPRDVELATTTKGSVDFVVVGHQVERVVAARPGGIALFGDSSCLMGVVPTRLGAALGGRQVESYCMLAYVGPAGYAKAFDRLLDDSAPPERVVLLFHPAQFPRDASWDGWPTFVADQLADKRRRLKRPAAGLDFLRVSVLGRVLYAPMPGNYGWYYGDFRNVVAQMDADHGGAIDPGAGMRETDLGQVEALAQRDLQQALPPCDKPMSYAINDAYREALVPLARSIARFGADKVLFAISPVPRARVACSSADVAGERAAAAREIAGLLGLPAANVVDSPATLATPWFSSETHLSRWGRQYFTDRFAAALAPHFNDDGVARP